MIRLALVLLAACARAQMVPEWDAREVEGFVDGLMAAQKNAHHFAGAVVVIVRDGQVAFEKGYGYSDFAARQPVDSKRTLFRVASNSKMFVWTAVMQLVEEGKLDLLSDVNKYLRGLQVPPTFAEPITLENLMTHTAGFEDKVIGLFAKSVGKMQPLSGLMKAGMPRRVFPPGKVTAYSNYGTSLAALIWVVAFVLGLCQCACTVFVWRRQWWRLTGRITITLVCLAAVGAVLWLHQWNLLGWNY